MPLMSTAHAPVPGWLPACRTTTPHGLPPGGLGFAGDVHCVSHCPHRPQRPGGVSNFVLIATTCATVDNGTIHLCAHAHFDCASNHALIQCSMHQHNNAYTCIGVWPPNAHNPAADERKARRHSTPVHSPRRGVACAPSLSDTGGGAHTPRPRRRRRLPRRPCVPTGRPHTASSSYACTHVLGTQFGNNVDRHLIAVVCALEHHDNGQVSETTPRRGIRGIQLQACTLMPT